MSVPGPLLMWGPSLLGVFFFFSFGATVGSFLNVVVYRLPRGQGLVTPASACPACGTTLTWRENLPIVGWLLLRGRCRFCKSPISPEYPIVEAVVALLFGGLFALWFFDAGLLRSIGIDAAALRPGWTASGFATVWPMFMLMLWLVGSLVAITLLDAKTFLIPLSIPWILICVALIAHPVFAAWMEHRHGRLPRSSFDWTLWTFDSWRMTLGVFGAVAGLALSNFFIRAGLLPRSFADYDEWEKAATEAAATAPEASGPTTEEHANRALGPILMRTLMLTGPAVALMAVGFSIGMPLGAPLRGMIGGMAVGLIIGLVLRRYAPESAHTLPDDPIWVQYPHARREMAREIIFLTPAFLLALGGFLAAQGWTGAPSLWIKALTGSLAGLLAGGGIVWSVRILGSLAFGKEAMGLGDVHLMAAVGATLGWIDPVLAFFLAPFFGIGWTLVATILSKAKRQSVGTALPYGPHLAAATIVVLAAKPTFEFGLSILMGRDVLIP